MALAWWLVPCLPFPGLPYIYFLFTVRLTNEWVGVFLARRSVQHLVLKVALKHHKPKPNLNQYYLTGIASFGHSKFLFLFIFSAQKNVLVVEVSKVQNKELVFDLEINSTGGIIKVSMSGSLCVSTHYSCFEDVDILRELTLDNRNKVCYNSKL